MNNNCNTLKKLAERSGYSLASVSRTLDPQRSHMVHPDTREKIMKHVRISNFSVNLSARRLKCQCTEVITGVSLFNQFKNKKFSGEFVSRSIPHEDMQGLACFAKQQRYDFKVEYIYPGMDFATAADDIIDRSRTDGIIFVGYHGDDFQRKLMQSGLPYIYMSRYINIERRDVPLVGLRRDPGYRAAMNHLLRIGRKRIAWIGVDTPDLTIKHDIVANLLREHGCYDRDLFFSVDNYYRLREIFAGYHPRQFDAVFCSNDIMAEWVVREARHNGFRVPDDLTVIGYDNDPTCHGEGSLEISSIGTPRHVMCEKAVELLLGMIADGMDPSRRAIFETGFFLRST